MERIVEINRDIKHTCIHCGGEFFVSGYQRKKHKGKYCSMKCYREHVSAKTYECAVCGKETQKRYPRDMVYSSGPFCSRSCSQLSQQARHRGLEISEWLEIRKSDEKKRIQSGNIHEWRVLKIKIKKRDGYKCSRCGSHDRLAVHHIIFASDRPDLFLRESNLETLCHECHWNIHRAYGRGKWQTE